MITATNRVKLMQCIDKFKNGLNLTEMRVFTERLVKSESETLNNLAQQLHMGVLGVHQMQQQLVTRFTMYALKNGVDGLKVEVSADPEADGKASGRPIVTPPPADGGDDSGDDEDEDEQPAPKSPKPPKPAHVDEAEEEQPAGTRPDGVTKLGPRAVEITYQGVTKRLADWAREKGLTPSALKTRLNNGWELPRAMETPAVVRSSAGDGKPREPKQPKVPLIQKLIEQFNGRRDLLVKRRTELEAELALINKALTWPEEVSS